MATNIEQIIDWFKQELKPNEWQFKSTWLSFWHKDEKIPISTVENLSTILNSKADSLQLKGHLNDPKAHPELIDVFIPLSGTTTSPIAGTLDFDTEVAGGGKSVITKIFKALTNGKLWSFGSESQNVNQKGFWYSDFLERYVSFTIDKSAIGVSSTIPNFAGIRGYEYYGDAATNLDFVQKQKVAAMIAANSDFTTQEILSGGNYNNLEVTADLLVFKNENAQAILNGVWGKKDFHILNLSNTYEVKINHNSASVTGNGQPIKLPTATGNMGIKGTARILQTAGYGYFVADTWGSRYRPEFKGLTEKKVVTVNENSEAEAMDMTELMVFRDAQSAPMTAADLNAAYPNVSRPFQVVCNTINLIYVLDVNSPKTWSSISKTKVV